MLSKKEEVLRTHKPWRPWRPKVEPLVRFSDLPMELLIKIFKYLNMSDINALSLTCKRFLEASKYYKFMDGRVLNLHKIDFHDNQLPISMLNKSFRHFTSVSLYLVRFMDDNLFWRIFGKFIKELSFRMCVIKKTKFLQILKLLPNLESLLIYNFDELLSTWDMEKEEKIKPFLPKLKVLKLQKINYCSPPVFDFIIDMMPNIESIEISDCFINCPAVSRVRIIDHIFYFVAVRAPYIHTLNLLGTPVDDIGLGKLGSVNGLKLNRFSLTFNGKISDDGILTLVNALETVTYLDMTESLGLVDDGMSIICRRMPFLKTFIMKQCVMVTCNGMKELVRLKHLEVLDVTECERIRDEGLTEGLCPKRWQDWKQNMRELHMGSMTQLTELSSIRIMESFHGLTLLDMSGSSNCMSDFVMQLINCYLLNLQHLNLDGCGKLSDAGVTGIGFVNEYCDRYSHSRNKLLRTSKKSYFSINRLVRLRTLKMSGCYHISDESLKHFQFKELKDLVISRCPQITINGIRAITEHCPGIEMLDITECKNMTDKCIEIIAIRLKRLKTLRVICCSQLTKDSIHSIALHCKVIKNLYIRGCLNIQNAEDILYGVSSLKNIYAN